METTPLRAYHQVTFAVLAVRVGAFAMLASLVVPVLLTIEAALGTNQTNVTWVLTAYLLSAPISRVAGVGPGTLYRRFPTKDALVGELVRQFMSDAVAIARSGLELADGSGLEHIL